MTVEDAAEKARKKSQLRQVFWFLFHIITAVIVGLLYFPIIERFEIVLEQFYTRFLGIRVGDTTVFLPLALGLIVYCSLLKASVNYKIILFSFMLSVSIFFSFVYVILTLDFPPMD